MLFAQGFHCTGMPIKVRRMLTQSAAARPPPHAAARSGGCTSRIWVWAVIPEAVLLCERDRSETDPRLPKSTVPV